MVEMTSLYGVDMDVALSLIFLLFIPSCLQVLLSSLLSYLSWVDSYFLCEELQQLCCRHMSVENFCLGYKKCKEVTIQWCKVLLLLGVAQFSGGGTKDHLGDNDADLVCVDYSGTRNVKGDYLIHIGVAHKGKGGNFLPQKIISSGLMGEGQLYLSCSGDFGLYCKVG